MSDPQTEQRLNDVDERIEGISRAVNMLVTQFLHPLTQQSVENQKAIARLIERSERHQEWRDEDRQDLAEWRQTQAEQSRQIQALIDSANADRIKADERFEQMQSEIRQNQRLLLEGQARLEQNDQRFLEAQERFRQNEQRLEMNQRHIAATLDEVVSLSHRVQAIEEIA